jgi:hypothetical protein
MDYTIMLRKENWRLSMNRKLFQLKFKNIMLANSHQDYRDLVDYLRLNRIRESHSCYVKVFNTETNTTLVLHRREIQDLCFFIAQIDENVKLIKTQTHFHRDLDFEKQMGPCFEKQLFKN